jgi:hypothetical protein
MRDRQPGRCRQRGGHRALNFETRRNTDSFAPD